MNRRSLLSGLYRMHGTMLAYSSVWALLVGIVVVLLMKQTSANISFTKAAGACVAVGLLSWVFSLLSPMSFQLHKYILPMAMPLLGTALFGISGMVLGYAGSFFLRIIGDLRRFAAMVYLAGRGPDPKQYNPLRDIILRPAFAALVAGVAIALTLRNFGVELATPGRGYFSAIIDASPEGKLPQLPVFCLIWAFTRQLFESGVDIWTTPAFWSRR
jgi:hypothetical protein